MLATAISAPALVYSEKSASLSIVLPMLLTIETDLTPNCLAYLIAIKVSILSPDWLIEIINPLGSTNGSLYLYSLAISTLTVILHKLSIQYFAINPA